MDEKGRQNKNGIQLFLLKLSHAAGQWQKPLSLWGNDGKGTGREFGLYCSMWNSSTNMMVRSRREHNARRVLNESLVPSWDKEKDELKK